MSALVKFIRQPFHKWGKQKGVTFLEILAVLVILVLIYLAYSRSFSQGTDKAKLSDVQNSFRQYQVGFENAMDEASGLPSGNGINIDYATLNKYLNKDFQISSPTSGIGSTHPSANPIQTSQLKDPWGNYYQIQAEYVSPQESLLIVRSTGEDKKSSVTNDLFSANGATDNDDLFLVTDFKNGMVKSCTKGLSKNLGTIATAVSGSSSSAVDYDVPLAQRQTFLASNAHEYAVEATFGTETYRTYIYSNTPLSLSINHGVVGKKHLDEYTYDEISSSGNFVGFNYWNSYVDTDWSGYISDIGNSTYVNPVSFTTPTNQLSTINTSVTPFDDQESMSVDNIGSIDNVYEVAPVITGCN